MSYFLWSVEEIEVKKNSNTPSSASLSLEGLKKISHPTPAPSRTPRTLTPALLDFLTTFESALEEIRFDLSTATGFDQAKGVRFKNKKNTNTLPHPTTTSSSTLHILEIARSSPVSLLDDQSFLALYSNQGDWLNLKSYVLLASSSKFLDTTRGRLFITKTNHANFEYYLFLFHFLPFYQLASSSTINTLLGMRPNLANYFKRAVTIPSCPLKFKWWKYWIH